MNNTFSDLGYTAEELSVYICSGNTFVLALKSSKVVKYVAADACGFKEWLACHGITDRTEETGALVMEHYFPGYYEFTHKAAGIANPEERSVVMYFSIVNIFRIIIPVFTLLFVV